jgi:type VI secretion system protein ImpB
MADSTQHKLDRVRSPRVQITYDVEVGGALEQKELPFVMGVMGDYSGNPADPLPKLKDRKFVNIDRDNFNDVLKGCKPRLTYRVDNTMTDEGGQMPVELTFRNMADFEPAQVASQIEPLRKLMEIRGKLSDLKNKMYGNDKLGELLNDILQDTDKLAALGKEVAPADSGEKK